MTRYGKTLVLCGSLIALLALSGCASTGEGGGNNLTMQLNEIIESTSSTLHGIMGADEATGAHHSLMEQDAELQDVVEKAASAPPEVQMQLADMARKALPGLEEAAVHAMNQPGVGDKIGGAVKSIVDNLTKLIGT